MTVSVEKALGAFLTAWLLVGLICRSLVVAELGPWIELFNGATWPSSISAKDGGLGHLFCFYAVLSLRTILNLGIVLTAGWALVVLLGGGIERFVMRRMESVLHGRDTALASYLIKVMREEHIPLPEDIVKRLIKATNDFPNTPAGKLYSAEAKKADATS